MGDRKKFYEKLKWFLVGTKSDIDRKNNKCFILGT